MSGDVVGLSWTWIAVMLLVPLPVAALAAAPVWRRSEFILGNLAGSAVIFGTSVTLIFRERVALDALVQACLDKGVACWPDPSPFDRYAIFAGIAFVQVIALFAISLRVEARLKNRAYAPEWRR
jgi:hypothetical protein